MLCKATAPDSPDYRPRRDTIKDEFPIMTLNSVFLYCGNCINEK